MIPWTVLLACVDPALFPSRFIQHAWIAFDVVLCAALFRLSTRFRRSLATALAVVVTADAALTVTQAVSYNIPRARSFGEWSAILLAILAPSVAATILWNMRALRQRLLASGTVPDV